MNRYLLCIKGKNPDYFLKKILEKQINIYELRKDSKTLHITVDIDGYKKIKKIKTSYQIVLEDVTGILKVRKLFSKYFFFVMFFILGIFLNIFLSKIIFDVEVVHSNKFIRELVYNDLRQLGIKKFNFKVNFEKKEAIVKTILNKEKDDLEWMEIEEVGTKYIIKVEQRKKNKEGEACSNRNVVAKKAATILEIFAEAGEVIKKKQDYVVAGEVIISGVIHNKEETVANKCARGKVFGEVWYKVDVELPAKYKEIQLTGKSRRQIEVNFLDKKYVLFNNYDTYKKEDTIVFQNKLLPINIGLAKYFETKEKNYSYTLDNCDYEALKIAFEHFQNKLGKEDEILTKKVLKKTLKNSKIIVEVFFKVKEDITAYQDIIVTEENKDGD